MSMIFKWAACGCATAVVGPVVTLWATLFVSFWRRKEADYAYMWGISDAHVAAENRAGNW